jgi:glycosyltransferase involved in cell wall biosynthesis
MTTYKHERFITQAVESVMMQETDFPYELVLGEDCSPDRTRAICLELQRKYPDRIRLLLPEQNLGMRGNDLLTLRACDGDYIAMLDGDDFWTSKDKLKKQVQFLENHPECSACCHPVTQFCEDGREPAKIVGLYPGGSSFSLSDLISEKIAATCSVLYRNCLRGRFPEWYEKIGYGDRALQVLHGEHGLLGYLDENMASYRLHPGGIWSTTNRLWQLQQLVFLYESLNGHLDSQSRPKVRQCLSRRSYQLSVHCLGEGRIAEARRSAWRSIAACPLNPTVSLLKRGKQLAISMAPALSRLRASVKSGGSSADNALPS